MRLRIPRDSLLVFPTSSTLYVLHGRFGAARGSGFVDDVTLVIAGEFGVGGWG